MLPLTHRLRGLSYKIVAFPELKTPRARAEADDIHLLSISVTRWVLLLCAATLAMASQTKANPAGGSVRHGSATIVQNGNLVTINQASGMAILDWNSFSIAQGESTKFVQPNSSSMALNRVNGGTQSLINGRLEANGGVILINPAGILVGKSGVINVNTFIGSTRDVSDTEFLAGGAMKFSGNSASSIQNLGTIHAESGDIYLIARSIDNQGTLSAKKGTVGLAAADEVVLQPAGDEKLSILTQSSTGGQIANSGTIRAVAAEIKAAGNPYAVAINLDGVIKTRGNASTKTASRVLVQATEGDIAVSSSAKISASGKSVAGTVTIETPENLEIGGTIMATSSSGAGGQIRLLGQNIHLDSTVVVDASGFTGGGTILVGGDYQGGNNPTMHYSSTALPNAQTLQVDQGAKLMANATGNGNGGTIIQWSDGTTVSSGSVSVQGGPLGGNGGFAEISGKQNLGFDGSVELSAPNGKAGTVLFDPTDLWIVGITASVSEAVAQYNSILNLYNNPPPPTWFTILTHPVLSDPPTGSVMTASSLNGISSGTIVITASNITFSGETLVSFVGSYWGGSGMINANYNEHYYGNPAIISLQNGVSINVNASGQIYMPPGSSITASGVGGVQLTAVQDLNLAGTIQSGAGGVSLTSQSGNIDLLSGSSISALGNGGVWVTANQTLSLAGQINSVNGDIHMDAHSGNLNLAQGSQVQSTGSGNCILQSDSGSISGASALTAVTGYIDFFATTGLSFQGPIQAGHDVFLSSSAGDVTLNGSINTGYLNIVAPGNVTLNGLITSDNYIYTWAGSSLALGNLYPTSLIAGHYIDLGAHSYLTVNGPVTTDNYINLSAGNSLTLGNLFPTSLIAPNNINLSAPHMNLTATFQTTAPDSIALNNLAGANSIEGGVVIDFLNNLNLYSTSLNQFSSDLGAGSFLTVQAPEIDIQNTSFTLNPNVSLSLIASGSSSVPGALNFHGNTITVQGSGNITLIGNGDVFLTGSSITAAQGDITIASLTGNINLSAQISSSAAGNAVGLSAMGNFNADGNSSIIITSPLGTPAGRWIIYSTDPSANNVVALGLRSPNAVYAETATSLPPSSVPYPGNYYVYSAPIHVDTRSAPVAEQAPVESTSSALHTQIASLILTPSFAQAIHSVTATLGGAPAAGGAGPAGFGGGPSMGGFGSPGPAGGSSVPAGSQGAGSAGGLVADNGGGTPPGSPGVAGADSGGGSPGPGAPGGDSGASPGPGSPGSTPGSSSSGGSVAGGASAGGAVAGGPAGAGGAAGGSHTGGTAGSSSGSGSGQVPAHVPASVVAATKLNSPVSTGNSAAAAFNRLNPTISAGEGVSEESSSSGGGAESQGASQVNQSRASSRFGGIGSDPTPGGDLNSLVQVLAL
jgi:filamentous hemagglutinin family protein